MFHFPFERDIFIKALKYAVGVAAIGFVIIQIGWGEITLTDVVGMCIATPLVAYLIHMIMLFNKEE